MLIPLIIKSLIFYFIHWFFTFLLFVINFKNLLLGILIASTSHLIFGLSLCPLLFLDEYDKNYLYKHYEVIDASYFKVIELLISFLILFIFSILLFIFKKKLQKQNTTLKEELKKANKFDWIILVLTLIEIPFSLFWISYFSSLKYYFLVFFKNKTNLIKIRKWIKWMYSTPAAIFIFIINLLSIVLLRENIN